MQDVLDYNVPRTEMPADSYLSDTNKATTLSYYQNTNALLSNPVVPSAQPVLPKGVQTGGQTLNSMKA